MLSTPRSQTLAAATLLFALVLLAFGGALGNGLVFDDHRLIERNPVVRTLDPQVHLSNPYWSRWAEPYSYYRPLVTWTLALDRQLFSGEAFGFHLTNLLMHALNALLLFLVIRSLAGPLVAVIAAALFAVHPVTSEAVVWAVGRTDLQATLFLLLALLLHSGLPDRPGRRDLPRIGGTLLALAAALGSKEMAVTFPALVLAYDLARARSEGESWGPALRRALRRGLRYLPIYLALIGAYLLLRLHVGGELLGGLEPEWLEHSENPLTRATATERLLTAVNIAARYLRLIVFPGELSALYTYDALPLVRSAGSAAFLLPLALVFVAVSLLVLAARRWPAALFGALAAGGSYLLVSHLLFAAPIPMAERAAYLPLAGLAAVAGAALVALARRAFPGERGAAVAAALVLLLLIPLGLRSRARTPDWSDDLTLFEATVRTQPRCAAAWKNLAAEQLKRGDLLRALDSVDRALEIFPRFATSHLARADILRRMGDLPGAESVLRALDEDLPGTYPVRINLVQILAARAEEEGARGRGTLAARFREEIVDLASVQAAQAADEGLHGAAAAFRLEEARALGALDRAAQADRVFAVARQEAALEVTRGGATRERARGLETSVLGAWADFLSGRGEAGRAAPLYGAAASSAETGGLAVLAGGMRINEGRSLQALDRREEALHAYLEAERLAPEESAVIEAARTGRAYLLAAAGETEAVDGLVPGGYEDTGLAAAVWLAAAEGSMAGGRAQEALPFYDRFLALRPTQVRALHGRGRARLERGVGEGAEQDLQEALGRAPSSRVAAALWLDLARAALLQGRAEEAHRRLGRALEADEAYGEALLRQGLMGPESAPGGPGALAPGLAPEAWYRLGVLAAARGRTEEAEESLRRCLTLRPDHRDAAALLRRVRAKP